MLNRVLHLGALGSFHSWWTNSLCLLLPWRVRFFFTENSDGFFYKRAAVLSVSGNFMESINFGKTVITYFTLYFWRHDFFIFPQAIHPLIVIISKEMNFCVCVYFTLIPLTPFLNFSLKIKGSWNEKRQLHHWKDINCTLCWSHWVNNWAASVCSRGIRNDRKLRIWWIV